MMIEPTWWEYAVFDDDGYLCGISDNAPVEEKEKYNQYIAEKNVFKSKGEPIPK